MVICSERNKSAGYAALILSFSLLMGVPSAFGEEPNDINTNAPSAFLFTGNVVSNSFQIGNKGTGILDYTLSIIGTNAAYFTVDGNSGDVHGEVNGVSNKNTHVVDVNYGQLHNTLLSAQLVIKNDNNNADVFYISLMAQAPAEPNEPNTPASSPEIGKSASHINLIGKVLSKKFQIWNNGTGTLDYTLAIGGDDADYFTLDKEEGQSLGTYDKRTHTVSVTYDDDFHNQTLNAWIEITDANDNTAYIDLSATETIATRVSYIAIEQGIDYGIEGEDDDINDFRLYINTDDTVDEITLTTPEGSIYTLTDADYNDSDDNSVRYWTYAPDDVINFSDYGDGQYIIEVNYTDGNTAQTVVNFGIPNKPGTIVWPTQTPNLINPLSGEQTVSPLRFKWDKCVDPNANGIRLILENWDSDIRIEKKYSKSTTKPSAIDLEVGSWDVELDIGRWYQNDKGNNDGIEYEVGKWSRSYSSFEIMKWFGTFDEFKNRPLKTADCNGTEVTFNLTGGGWGEIEDTDCGFTSIVLTDTNDKSVFSITTKKGAKTAVGNIETVVNETPGNIKSITGKNVNLEGNITIADGDGAAGAITLNNVTNSNITIGPATQKTKSCVLKFNQITALDLTSGTPVRDLQATHWNSGSLNAPWISTMTIKGNFGADLTLSGDQSPKGMTLNSAKIAGAISGEWNINDGNCGSITFASSTDAAYTFASNVGTIKAAGNKKTAISSMLSGTWQFSSVKTIIAADINQCSISATQPAIIGKLAIGKITAKGWINDCVITATGAGNIGAISAGGIKDCSFSTDGSISKIENKGIRDNTFCYINSNITAGHIGTAIVAYPKYNNGGHSFGLTTNSIGKLTLKDSSRKTTWLDPNLSTAPIIIDDFQITLPSP